MTPIQTPAPGIHRLLYTGDVFQVTLKTAGAGRAFLRTNLGNAAVRRAETISVVDCGLASPGQDWHDIPMTDLGNGEFTIRLALVETGHFEAKAFFVPENSSAEQWPDGQNVHVNVSPAPYCCANSIYCAFVRQFGENKTLASTDRSLRPLRATAESELDHENYTVIPSSGTFRALIRELDHIFDRMKCRILHLLPVNPTPTVYGRMGRFGSPYASLDFTAVNPELAEFDKTATPLEQFLELVDAVHSKNGKLFIDIAVNHTGWASKIHEIHPEWLKRRDDGTIISPGAWGTVWEDLTELDYSKKDLWKYIADVFIIWCQRGVDGFRCDAGYMIPVPAWEYIIARVREQFPDIIFLLEGLGGDPAVTTRLLDYANMNWAYSELFQNYSKEQIEGYLNYAWRESNGNGLMVHYAETHDNSRLAAVSENYARMRTALSALASVNGAFGFANGVEWFAKEKIDVHESRGLSWGATPNLVEFIGKLNTLLLTVPAFHNGANMAFLNSGSPNAVLFRRTDASGKGTVLCAVNLDCEHPALIQWNAGDAGACGLAAYDLISARTVDVKPAGEMRFQLELAPGEALCLSGNPEDLLRIREASAKIFDRFSKSEVQEAQAMALKCIAFLRRSVVLQPDDDQNAAAKALLESPEAYLKTLQPDLKDHPYVPWRWPEDAHRKVMVPPGKFILAVAPFRFRASLNIENGNPQEHNSLVDARGRHFAIFYPQTQELPHKRAVIRFSAFSGGKVQRSEGHLLLLAPDILATALSYSHDYIRKYAPLTCMQANGRGALMHLRLDQPDVSSRYDAVMLANLSPDHPEDRHIMFRRLRVWVLHHARTQEVSLVCLRNFERAADGGCIWNYHVPTGNGLYTDISLKIEMVAGKNQTRVSFLRRDTHGREYLEPESPVKLIVRPDVEDRNFHYSTKANGLESVWPGKVNFRERGFDFTPTPGRTLTLTASSGRFVPAAEWNYMLWQPNEAARGLDPYSDVYSPGYFEINLTGGGSVQIAASILTDAEPDALPPAKVTPADFRAATDSGIETNMLDAMRAFVVKRGNLKTVIAGYPWFLDWGRDTLIAARGLIAAREFRDDVKAIIRQFAMFADQGTIPNIIHGDTVGNRDTSDAQLWLFTAVEDLCKAERSNDFLKTEVRPGKTILDQLEEIASDLIAGTPNGIKADPESGLVFSPPHFTWMDTNYPAGTPREGYPVEIQALWFAALRFLSSVSATPGRWKTLAEKVRTSIRTLFLSDDGKYLSDCLHCTAGTPAAKAVKDDHIRPNQIFAITLGAIDDKELGRSILDTAACLLIPGAIRSLADKPTRYPLPVRGMNGNLLNDPSHPYWGRYEGDEDTRRKPAYHNGTAWTWPFPSYCEAYAMMYEKTGAAVARSLLSSCEMIMRNGCVGHLAEILDGDYPHTQRGCDAQAWGITEYYRVWKLLHR